jgi:hypothetical protein
MQKTAVVLVAALSALSVLSGCGGDDAYCAAVKDNKAALNGFLTKKTDAAFTGYVKAARAITATAPDSSKDEWAKVASATDRVLKAHRKAGISIQDLMNDPDERAKLDEADLASIQKTFDAFNKTAEQRTAVVKDVKDVCDITLS